ncbi:MAG TPA: hypothetical protein VJ650_04110 [Gemmatimonadaceae bacterium]|nr:hypothetical protein [Gemmatimonadaceae bacterium]
MYSTCLFCHASLGANEAIEHFPVGRRLAFDSAKGRLWVVCRGCERWNLSPLEERWEAIEECERQFEKTRMRVSTDNIGLARLSEGIELVRIGPALRPEFAAWRYGDQFGRRRRRTMLQAGLGLGALGAVVAGGIAAGVGIGGFGWMMFQSARFIIDGNPRTVLGNVTADDGETIAVRRLHLRRMRWRIDEHSGEPTLAIGFKRGLVTLRGEEARRQAGILIVHANRRGGTRKQVQQAVDRIQIAGSAEALLTASQNVHPRPLFQKNRSDDTPPFGLLPDRRLALEMALHEEQERRALQGELRTLEQAWREAEDIAQIADNLLVPESDEEWLRKQRANQ